MRRANIWLANGGSDSVSTSLEQVAIGYAVLCLECGMCCRFSSPKPVLTVQAIKNGSRLGIQQSMLALRRVSGKYTEEWRRKFLWDELRPLLVAIAAFFVFHQRAPARASLFMLQVFDRVLPSNSQETLLVLLAGTVWRLILLLLDYVRNRRTSWARSSMSCRRHRWCMPS